MDCSTGGPLARRSPAAVGGCATRPPTATGARVRPSLIRLPTPYVEKASEETSRQAVVFDVVGRLLLGHGGVVAQSRVASLAVGERLERFDGRVGQSGASGESGRDGRGTPTAPSLRFDPATAPASA